MNNNLSQSVTKKKRELTLATIAIGSLIILGTSGIVAFVLESFSKPQLENVLQKTYETDEKLAQILDHQAVMLQETQYAVKQLQAEVNRLEEQVPKIAAATAMMVYQLNRQMQELEDLFRNLQGGTIKESFFRYFQIKLPCNGKCMYDSITDIKNIIIETNDTIVLNLNFTIQIQEENKEVLEVEAFRTILKNDTKVCDQIYIGPKYL